MYGWVRAAAAVALAVPAGGQLLVEPGQTEVIARVFEGAPGVSTLRCEIAPMNASLNYGFQFQTVYRIQIPLTQFHGADHTVNTYTRVTPEGKPPVYLTKYERLPAARGMETDAESVGAFIVGEGTYRAEVVVEDDADRVCRSTWQIQARRNSSEKQLRLATPPGTVQELTLEGTPPGDARPGPRVGRLTILVNAVPLAAKATALSAEDVQKTVDTVTSILREMPAQTVRLIAFNLDQRAIIFQDEAYEAGNTGELAEALRRLDFSVLDYKAIRDRMEPLELLLSIVQAELGAPQPPDAMVVIGPRTQILTPLPADAMNKRPNATTQIFSLQFQIDRPGARFPRVRPEVNTGMDASQSQLPRRADQGVMQRMSSGPVDVVERLVARLKGQTIAIRNPHDLADAIQRMDSRVAKTAPAAAPAARPVAPAPTLPAAPKLLERAPRLAGEPTGDEDPVDVLMRVRDLVMAHGERIPNHTCVENVQRDTYDSTAGRAQGSCDAVLGFRKQRDFLDRLTLNSTDWLRLDIAYSPGKEIFSWAGANKFEEGDLDELVPEGAIGTGAFTWMVLSAFGQRGPKYVFDGETMIEGRRVFEYSFTVARENSHYRVKAGNEWVITGYAGTLLVDPKIAELVKVVVRTEELPPASGMCETDITMEYDMVKLKGSEYLLPSRAHQRFIGRDGYEMENTMTFTACRDFQAESKVEFGAGSDGSEKAAPVSTLRPALPSDLPVTVELTSAVHFGTAAAGDLIEGRLAEPILDANQKMLAAAGTPVQGRLMRVELQHLPQTEHIVALRWEAIRMGGTFVPLSLTPRRRNTERLRSLPSGLRRRGFEIVLPRPSESKYAVILLEGMALDSGTRTEWVTGKR